LKAAHAEATAALPTAVMTELLASTSKRNTHMQSPAERLQAQQQIKALRRQTEATQGRRREEKQDTVLDLLDELDETLLRRSSKRHVLGALPDDAAEAELSDAAAEKTSTDGTQAQLLSDTVGAKGGAQAKA
jgi:ATP-dependent DNA ligase